MYDFAEVIFIKDIYFSDLNGSDFSGLSEEEKRLIQQHRLQKELELNRQNPESFYTKPASAKSPTAEIPIIDEDFIFSQSQNYPVNNEPYYQPQPNYTQQETYYPEEYEDIYPPQPPKPPKKRKKGCGCGCLGASFVALFLAVVIAFTGTFGYIYSLMGKTKQAELDDNSSHSLLSDESVMNILLIGLDEDQNGTSRSDTMMLMSIDKENKAIKLTSFLRDMWVDIPEHKSAKLNASYAYGGAQLTVDTLEANFNIDIDHFVLVDFNMFKKIIKALGGVDVEITEKEAKFINNTTRQTVKAGLNHLNGEEALVYARIRKLDSDFFRTQRQRKVISAIIEKAADSPFSLVSSLAEIMPLITTDIEPLELTKLAFFALQYIKFDVESLQVPADDAYNSKKIQGQSALVPDMDKNKSNIKEFIYG